jgi:hypothetical protein
MFFHKRQPINVKTINCHTKNICFEHTPAVEEKKITPPPLHHHHSPRLQVNVQMIKGRLFLLIPSSVIFSTGPNLSDHILFKAIENKLEPMFKYYAKEKKLMLSVS